MSEMQEVTGDPSRIIETLVDGFLDNPFMSWVFPDESSRAEALTAWYEVWLGAYGNEALCFEVDGGAGATLWAVPGAKGLTDESFGALFALIERYNGDRTGLVMQGLAPIGEHPEQPYWYLNSIAARRGGRAKGVGARLLAPMLDRADRERLPVYLESSNPRNLTFYYRYGFEDWNERLDMPEGGPSMQKMLRPCP